MSNLIHPVHFPPNISAGIVLFIKQKQEQVLQFPCLVYYKNNEGISDCRMIWIILTVIKNAKNTKLLRSYLGDKMSPCPIFEIFLFWNLHNRQFYCSISRWVECNLYRYAFLTIKRMLHYASNTWSKNFYT